MIRVDMLTRVFRLLLTIALVTTVPCLHARPQLSDQDSLQLNELANLTGIYILDDHPKSVIIAPRETCNLAPPICEAFDAALRTDLRRTIPGIGIVGREEAVSELKSKGFLAIDAYNPAALRVAALSLNSDAIVTEDLLWQNDGNVLRIMIYDVKTNERLVRPESLQVKIFGIAPGLPDNPFLVGDPDTGVSVIVFKGPMPKHFAYPGCDRCPDPKGVGHMGSVLVIGTITPEGKIESVSVVRTSGPDFTKAALDALRRWRFKPAVGMDGKAFATRSDIEVTFHH
jgi:TonB family protein